MTSMEAGSSLGGWGASAHLEARSFQFQWAAHGGQETKPQSGERWISQQNGKHSWQKSNPGNMSERVMTRERAGLSLGCGGWGLYLPREFLSTARVTQVLCRRLPYLFVLKSLSLRGYFTVILS